MRRERTDGVEDNPMHAVPVRKRNRQVGCIIAVVRLSRSPQPRLQAMPASVPKNCGSCLRRT